MFVFFLVLIIEASWIINNLSRDIFYKKCSYQILHPQGNNIIKEETSVVITQSLPNNNSYSQNSIQAKQMTFVPGADIRIDVYPKCKPGMQSSKKTKCRPWSLCYLGIDTNKALVINNVNGSDGNIRFTASIGDSYMDDPYFRRAPNDPIQMYSLKVVVGSGWFGESVELGPFNYTIGGVATADSVLRCYEGESPLAGFDSVLTPGTSVKCVIDCIGYPGGSGRRSLGSMECSPLQFSKPILYEKTSKGLVEIQQDNENGEFDGTWMSNINPERQLKGANNLFAIYRAGSPGVNKTYCFGAKVLDPATQGYTSLIKGSMENCIDVQGKDIWESIKEFLITIVVLVILGLGIAYFVLKN